MFHLSYLGVRETTLAETDAHHLSVKVYHELRVRLCAFVCVCVRFERLETKEIHRIFM